MIWLCGLLSAIAALPEDLITGLNHDEYPVRQQSQNKLLEWARMDPLDRAKMLLLHARDADNPEVQLRCHNVLRELSDDVYLSDGSGFLGINMLEILSIVPDGGEEARKVVLVTRIVPDSAAQNAGLQVGDLIVGMNGTLLDREAAMARFMTTIAAYKPRQEVPLMILRDGEMLELKPKLGRRPPGLEDRNSFFGQPMSDANILDQNARLEHFKLWLQNLEN